MENITIMPKIRNRLYTGNIRLLGSENGFKTSKKKSEAED